MFWIISNILDKIPYLWICCIANVQNSSLSIRYVSIFGWNIYLQANDKEILDEQNTIVCIYAFPTVAFLGRKEPSDITFESNEKKPVIKFYELKKFCKMLSGGHPSAIELLYLDDDKQFSFISEEFAQIRSLRSKFIARYSLTKCILCHVILRVVTQ
jgi:hypothetical protein